MEIVFSRAYRTYELRNVSETELQIINRAFEYDTPFSDIPELALFSRDIKARLSNAVDKMLARYEGTT